MADEWEFYLVFSCTCWTFLELLGARERNPNIRSAYRVAWRSFLAFCNNTVGDVPQNWHSKETHFWESQKAQNSKAGTALDKILFRIWYLCWNLTTL